MPIVFAAGFVAMSFFFMVENPVWLVANGKDDKAEKELGRLHDKENVNLLMHWIHANDRRTKLPSMLSIWTILTKSKSLEHVDTVKQYVALRLVKDTKATLQLVSDSIQFYSQRDGSYKGKDEFRVYLEKTKVEGTWEPAAIEDGDDEHVVVRGVVRIFYIPISVKSTFSFDDEGRICNIHTGKA
ncbi:hypothetical protein BBI17_006280 [Phytophthora kernoviae]|uniref:Major facilitator superfamily (MFS) profile domain-containing protein n=1 Tax=Phytophthora kernoviae TaxID=325452 RepID=A0A3R7FWR2_9STRA|nr:hypothetical protein BBI17_006280 [Phytophthora kernoviae]